MLDILATLKYNICKEVYMNMQDFIALLKAMLQDEVEGTVAVTGNRIAVTFENGETRTVTVA